MVKKLPRKNKPQGQAQPAGRAGAQASQPRLSTAQIMAQMAERQREARAGVVAAKFSRLRDWVGERVRPLCVAVAARLRAREIKGPDGTPYLRRYFIGKVLGRTFYLHEFVDSDPRDDMHDHPWAVAGSIVLAGTYREERIENIFAYKVRKLAAQRALYADVSTPFMQKLAAKLDEKDHFIGEREHSLRPPFSVTRIHATTWHRVALPPFIPARTVWTLFWHGPYTKGWGFVSDRAVHEATARAARTGQPRILPIEVHQGPAGSTGGRWWQSAPTGAQLWAESAAHQNRKDAGAALVAALQALKPQHTETDTHTQSTQGGSDEEK